MKKRLSALIFAAIMLLSLLAGCGATGSTMDTAAATVENASAYDYGYTYEETAASSDEAVEAKYNYAGGGLAQTQSPAVRNAKLIYSADIGLETTEFDSAVSQLEELVSSLGGYFESSNIDNYGTYRSGYYTVRVPAESFEEFCNQASGLCRLNYINRSAEDISESYYDTEARLETQKTKLARLRELLAGAESMEDIITIESAISETELNIEKLTGTMRQYDSLVGYSTISLSLSEVYRLSDIEEPAIGFGAKLLSALKQGCRNFVSGLEELAIAIAYGWVGWLIFIAAAVIIIRIAVKKIRRVRKSRAAAPGAEKNNSENDEK